MKQLDSIMPTRRVVLQSTLSALVLATSPVVATAAAPPGFDQWREAFHRRALASGITAATWNRAMAHVEPDMTVFKQFRSQPEFHEKLWQYLNQRVSDWRIVAGKAALRKNAALFARIERDFGV